MKQIECITHHKAKRNDSLQIQGLIVKLKCKLSLGFTYFRTSPTLSDITYLKQVFGDRSSLMGDLNINHRVESQKKNVE